jgi:hypothetical protein
MFSRLLLMKKKRSIRRKTKSPSKNRQGFVLLLVLAVAVAAWAAVDTIKHISNSEAGNQPTSTGPVWVAGYENKLFTQKVDLDKKYIDLLLSGDADPRWLESTAAEYPGLHAPFIYSRYKDIGLFYIDTKQLIKKFVIPPEHKSDFLVCLAGFTDIGSQGVYGDRNWPRYIPGSQKIGSNVGPMCPSREWFSLAIDQSVKSALLSGRQLGVGIDNFAKPTKVPVTNAIGNSTVTVTTTTSRPTLFTPINFVVTQKSSQPTQSPPSTITNKNSSPTQSTPVANPPKLINYQVLSSSGVGGNYALTLSGVNLIINSSLAPEAGSTLTIRYKNGSRQSFNDKKFFGNKTSITMYVDKSSLLDNISSIDLTTPRGTTNTSIKK